MSRVVDTEKLVANYLRDEGFRVVGAPPGDRSTSWVRSSLINTANLSRPEWFTRSLIQLDCYAGKEGGQPEATTLALDVRESLEQLEGEQDLGVVTATRIMNQTRLADPAFEPARERVILQVEVHAHPVREAVA